MDKGNWILVVTTVITVSGTIAVAMINQQGKADKAAEAREVREVRPPTVDVRTDAVGTRPASRDERPERRVAAETVVEPEPEPVTPAVAAADISGAWHDIQHATYFIAQQGSAIRISSPQYPAGIGGGMIVGTAVQWDYRDNNGTPGRCSGSVAGEQMQVMCTALGVNYPFPLHRPNSG